MLDVAKVTEYGSYSYKHDRTAGKDNQGIEFGDIMTGSGKMDDLAETAHVRLERTTEVSAADAAVEVITYNQGAALLRYNSYIGVNLDIII